VEKQMGIVQRQQKWQDTQLGQLIIIGSRLMKKKILAQDA